MCLAAFNKNLTGIPWEAGFLMASAIATFAIVVADRRFMSRGAPVRLGPGGRFVAIWLGVYVALAVIISTTTSTSAIAVLVLPFVGATLVAGFADVARRMFGRG